MPTLKSLKHRLFILSLFIVISVLFILIVKVSTSANAENVSTAQSDDKQVADQPSIPKVDKAASSKVIVYYFYTTHRCYSCRMIEQYTKDAMETFFKEELASGRLEFKPLNIEGKGNKHFVKQYQLYTKSVVISLLKDKKEVSYKNLEKVWQYLKDKNKFFHYIKEEIAKVLKEAT